MNKILLITGLFFGVVIFFRMKNERAELEEKNKEKKHAKEDTTD